MAVAAEKMDAPAGAGPVSEVLVFALGGEEYAIPIRKVQEIRGYEKPTLVAGSAAHVLGVQNLRGQIVPILDLRIRLNLGDPRYDTNTVTVILNINGVLTGLVVDSVSDVVAISPEQTRPAPDLGAGSVDSRFITGIVSLDTRMLILADLDLLLAEQELQAALA